MARGERVREFHGIRGAGILPVGQDDRVLSGKGGVVTVEVNVKGSD